MLRAWNLMGGIDWTALPVVVDMLGIEDPELLLHQLIAIRNHQNQPPPESP